MSEEKDFVPGEIAVLKLPLHPTPSGAKRGFATLQVGEEIEIASYHHLGKDYDGYKFRTPRYPGYISYINHFRLTRKRLPPQELSKHTFHELINNLKDEKPLMIEEDEKV